MYINNGCKEKDFKFNSLPDMAKRSCKRSVTKAMEQLATTYTNFLQRHPFVVLVLTGLISAALTGLSYWHFINSQQDWNPKLGFEARGTKFSGRVMAWERLRKEISEQPSRKPYARQGRSVPNKEDQAKIPDWAKLLAGALLSAPCGQLNGDFEYMEYLVQVVFRVNSLETLFSLQTMQELCGLQQAIQPSIEEFESITVFKNLWNLPEYAVCYAAEERNDCMPTQAHVDKLLKTLQKCNIYRQRLLECQKKKLEPCPNVTSDCNNKLISDLFYHILPVDIFEPNQSPIYVNSFLPMFTYEAYRYKYRKTSDIKLGMYDRLTDLIEDYSESQQNIEMVGLQVGTKLNLFNEKLSADTWWGGVASVIVLCFIFGYSGSVFYTIMVSTSLLFSVGISYFLYTHLFQVNFFPFMNLLVVVLLVGIGADDTFVLNYIFSRTKKNMEQTKNEHISQETLHSAFSHAALSMFVTSATTAAAFYANMVSDVMTIRCFGIFAGTTMLVNYLLVVTWLPASLIVMDSYVNPLFRWTLAKLKMDRVGCCGRFRKLIGRAPKFFVHTCLAFLVEKLCWLWIVVISTVVCASGFAVFYYPGLSLPERNPIQVFKPSHPFEWYDNKAELFFPFASAKYEYRIDITVVWGFKTVTDASFVDPNDFGTLHRDTKFELDTTSKVVELGRLCGQIHNATFMPSPSHKGNCWATKFMQWSHKQPCHRHNPTICCNVSSHYFKESNLQMCLRYASKRVARVGDGLIFLNDSTTLVGYSMHLETRYTFIGIYDKLNKYFTTIDNELNVILKRSKYDSLKNAWFVTTFSNPLIWYDLLASLYHGTPVSVMVSIAVALWVVILSTQTFIISIMSIITICGVIVTTVASLVLLDWKINVIESTIIILTVGLSFDFTLHYAVAYKLAPKGSREEKVLHAFEFIGIPVLLSAVTTFCAGLAMVPSVTSAYYQIGVFMMLVTACSWLYSSVYFMALMSCFGPQEDHCAYQKVCCDSDSDSDDQFSPATSPNLKL